MATQMFDDPSRTYISWKNAKKVIDRLEDGSYHWIIASTEQGRFFPVILMTQTCEHSFHYFMNKGCCVRFG